MPRTARAFGSLEAAARTRSEIQQRWPALAAPAMRLFDADRGRIFRFWDRLSNPQRAALLQQVAQIDLDLLERNLALLKAPEMLAGRTAGALEPPRILEADTDPDAQTALELGEEVLRNGWLAVVEGAGGTGSRFFKAAGDHPKGLFPISPTGRSNFFEVRIGRLIALRRRYGKPIPYLAMVSDATEVETREWFEARDYFGLRDEMLIVRQRSLPYLEEVEPGEYDLVLERPDRVAVGGYGHADFTRHVLLLPEVQRFLAGFGTRYVQWLQIDNPLAVVGHRYLLGAHRRAEPTLDPRALAMSFIALKKEVALEAAGVLVRRGGGLAVWEYSDMDARSKHLLEHVNGAPGSGDDGRARQTGNQDGAPGSGNDGNARQTGNQDGAPGSVNDGNALELAVCRDGQIEVLPAEQVGPDEALVSLHALPDALAAGRRYRWGAINPNLVVVSLQSVLEHPEDNPPLVARKSAKHIDAQGRPGDPGTKFVKFEAFLFDGFNDGVVVAEAREECFAPTKNAEGAVDSPVSARQLMVRHAAERLRALGWEVSDEAMVELDGMLELPLEAVAARLGRNGRLEPGAVLSVEGLDLRIGDGLTVTSTGDLRIVADAGPKAPLEAPPKVMLGPNTIIDSRRVLP